MFKNCRFFVVGPLNGEEVSDGMAIHVLGEFAKWQNSCDIPVIRFHELTNYYQKMKIDTHEVWEGLFVTT